MRALVLATLVACSSSPPVDEPFTGTVHRFVIDRFDLPTTNSESRLYGDDLNGDTTVDNQVGQLTATLTGQLDLAPNPSDLRDLLPTAIEINAHDMIDDDHVGVSYIGRPGEMSTPATGTFVGGVYASERSYKGTHSANGSMVLPLCIDADPTEFPLQHGEIDLQPDGAGGYTGQLRGTIDPAVALKQAAASIYQMVRSNPKDHVDFVGLLTHTIFGDAPGVPLTLVTIESSSIMQSLLASDISFDGAQALSFGFQFHMVPCEMGTCSPETVIDHCDDRVQDADETDIDCGGSCHACGFDAKCVAGTDCQSGGCEANGICREPTCNDGVRDGFETGVDCGTYGCRPCN